MIVKGVDLNALPDQFQGCVAGRTLILDGDGPAYRCAATVKRLDTAVRRFQQEVLTQMFNTQSQDAIVHLTARDSLKAGRFNVIATKPYQGQRKSKDKPPLLEPLREAMAMRENWLPEFTVVMNRALEADDGMMHDAYRLKDSGVIWSDDKDLRMTPYPYFEKDKGQVVGSMPFGYIDLKYTPSGTPKLIGQGPLFFWAQMLMGDTADNVAGLTSMDGKQCGTVAAFNALKSVGTLQDAANLVVGKYRENNQNVLPEGWLLWLLRWPGDNFWNYLMEFQWTPENERFIHECSTREWFRTPTENSTEHDEELGA